MKKIKELWIRITSASVLWFVIPVFVVVIVPTLLYTRPLLNLTSDDITIYKFAITVLGVTVGIGTVVNSTRSAKISAESMNLTKEKELREQSSHLVPVSPVGEFQYLVPNYKKIDKFKDLLSEENGYHAVSAYIDQLRLNRYKPEELSEFNIKLMNVGKGTCVNLEFSFKILNLHEFDQYSFSNAIDELKSILPTQYTLQAYADKSSEGEDYIILNFDDFVIEKSLERFPGFVDELKEFSESIVSIKNSSTKRYIDVIEPQSELLITIPSDFIILCKQYLISTDQRANALLRDVSCPVENSPPVIPVGEITLSYHDESLIRLGELLPGKKTVYKYTIAPKDIRDLDSHFDLPFYLEINHLPN